MSRRKISWADLPSELLSAVAERLDNRSDILHFRVVCKTWLGSASMSLLPNRKILCPLLPHRLLTNTPPLLNDRWGNFGHFPCNSLILVACSVYLLRSCLDARIPPCLITVEELNPGKLHVREPLSRFEVKNLPDHFPKVLDLSHFHVLEIGMSYALKLGDLNGNGSNWKDFINKVVLLVDPNCESYSKVDDCFAMVLYDNGSLAAINLKNEQERSVHFYQIRKFDDIVSFKGRVYVVDRKGRAYCVIHDKLRIWNVTQDPLSGGQGSDRRKRLVEFSGELFLVHRCHEYNANIAFKVYKLNEEQRKWDEIEGIGADRILFVTLDGCFFASAKDFPGWKGNCIVFYRDSFPAYNNSASNDWDIFKTYQKTEVEIAVFHFEGHDCRPAISCRGYSVVLWPPPAWLSSAACLPKWYPEDDQRNTLSQKSSKSSGLNRTSCPLGFEVDVLAKEHSANALNLSIEALGTITPEIQGRTTMFLDSTLSTSWSTIVSSESVESGVSKVNFQGLDISSDVVPILRNIWTKHGDILEGHAIHSNNLLAFALESLARVIILLVSSSARSLNCSEADYLSSTLLDLRLMRLNVSWLVPFVEEALKTHKGIANREKLEETLQEIEQVTAQVEDMKKKLLAEFSELEQMLDKQRQKASESLTFLPVVAEDKSLGEGLFMLIS